MNILSDRSNVMKTTIKIFETYIIPLSLVSVFAYWNINHYRPIQNIVESCTGKYCAIQGLPINSIGIMTLLMMSITGLMLLSGDYRKTLFTPLKLFYLTFTPFRAMQIILIICLAMCFYFTLTFKPW